MIRTLAPHQRTLAYLAGLGAPLLVIPLTAGSAAAASAPAPSAVTSAVASAAAYPSALAGASPAFTEYNAATSPNAHTNGAVLAPDYQYGSLQAEATGRQAVQLVGQGKHVSFTLAKAANAVDFHYALPDSLEGGGINAPLDLLVDGKVATSLSLTSEFSWLYGTYPYTNTPFVAQPDGEVPHDYYNDVRYHFASTLPAGTVVTLRVDAGDDAPWYVVNTADFETVGAPIAEPASGYVDVTQAPYNVDDTGATDVTAALQNAIDAASAAGEGVYLPQGTYTISAPLNVNNVKVLGAGEWYTVLTGSNVEFNGQQNPASTNVDVSNLSMFGNVDQREDSDTEVTAFNGGFSHSRISNVWIQNEKVGVWITGPSTDLTLTGLRIQDTTADGVNLDAYGGPVTDTTVSNNFLRNTGDDGIALWSQNYGDTDDLVVHNTVDTPGLANNIGVYGAGAGDVVAGNLLQDTVQFGAGIGIEQRFDSVPMSGTLNVLGNELVRTGQFDPGNDYGAGSVLFYPSQGDMDSTVNVVGNAILDSPYAAFQFQNSNTYSGAAVTTAPTTGYSVSNVNIVGNLVHGVGTFVFQDQAPGSAYVAATAADGVGDAGVFSCGAGFTLTRGPGDLGFDSSTCGMPAASPLWAYPGTTTFEAAAVGQASPVQRVAIVNTASVATTLGAITPSAGFSVAPDPQHPCGTSLDAAAVTDTAAWCMVDVSFTPSADGVTQGSLTIASSQGTKTVALFGDTDPIGGDGGVAPPADLALTATLSSSSALQYFPASNANDGNNGSYWESQDGDAWPQTLTADLGAVQPEGSVVLTLPSNWGTRVQTIEVLGSTDGTTYSTLVPSADYTFDPSLQNTVTIPLPAGTQDRYLQISVTGNTGWDAAQISEFEIFG
ncbi:discoidin domain-containing protein [Actinospica durhamensis]|uniref:Discoidin domain-containing protein n=1 Tax=Actinospica durhamensis TaxID=1508375 RepID=A0A941ETJ9_9ACTN|nr:discoidin domain-containing protein [Actinospica durhamensis]MBR7836781.1 discoidin domain-containing protein [Actinospica durhamensis]